MTTSSTSSKRSRPARPGYVLKSVADRDLLEACRATLRGEPFLYAGAVTALIRDYLHRARHGDALPDTILTPREEEVLKLIAEGYSARDIAGDLEDQRQNRRPAPHQYVGQTRPAGPCRVDALRDPRRVDRAVNRLSPSPATAKRPAACRCVPVGRRSARSGSQMTNVLPTPSLLNNASLPSWLSTI